MFGWLIGAYVPLIRPKRHLHFLRGAIVPINYDQQACQAGNFFPEWHNFRRNHQILLSDSLYSTQELSIDMFTFSIGCPVLPPKLGSPLFFHEYTVGKS